MRTCERYKDDICTLGLQQFKPTEEFCASCDHYRGPSRGLGDDLSTVFKKTGVEKVAKAIKKNCGCGKRRASLNKRFPKEQSDG